MKNIFVLLTAFMLSCTKTEISQTENTVVGSSSDQVGVADQLTIVSQSKQSGFGMLTHSVDVPAGALIVIASGHAGSNKNCAVTVTPSLTVMKKADAQASNSGDAEIHYAESASGGTYTITTSFGASSFQTSVVYVITGYEAVGSSAVATRQTAPSVKITTTKENSLLIAVSADYNGRDGSTRAYRDGATEVYYQRASNKEGTNYHYVKLGSTIRQYTEGLSAPTTMAAGTAFVEIKSGSVIEPPPPPPVDTPPPPPTDTTPPPPAGGIEGFGAGVTGGSGSSTVYHVTNLNTSGSGSLSGGIGSNKTIVFDVSGTINGGLSVGAQNLTIDAYTSKQDITINGGSDGMNVTGSNIIIRGLRFTNCSNDGLNVTGSANNVVFDHCSSYGNRDGNIDLAATSISGKNFTVQWCFLGNNSGSGLMLITTQNASVHHNLFAGTGSGEGSERMPFAHSNYSPRGSGSNPNFDFRNNVLHNWGRYASGNGYGAVGNYVSNYYTSTKSGAINLCADNASCGTAYVSGNMNPSGTVNSSGGTRASSEYTPVAQYRVTTTDARAAAQAVLQNVGPYKRNQYEQDKINVITIQ